ncbi:hypothetical protein B0H13DRAFT_1852270 [Mycena leptocephala]|nr:hypothetical protein B0H13DRAFT_1852270 [Mycena leptocephala]
MHGAREVSQYNLIPSRFTANINADNTFDKSEWIGLQKKWVSIPSWLKKLAAEYFLIPVEPDDLDDWLEVDMQEEAKDEVVGDPSDAVSTHALHPNHPLFKTHYSISGPVYGSLVLARGSPNFAFHDNDCQFSPDELKKLFPPVQHKPVELSRSATKATLLADQQATVAARAVDLAKHGKELYFSSVWTPSGWFTDTHVDGNGTSQILVHVEGEKLWLVLMTAHAPEGSNGKTLITFDSEVEPYHNQARERNALTFEFSYVDYIRKSWPLEGARVAERPHPR